MRRWILPLALVLTWIAGCGNEAPAPAAEPEPEPAAEEPPPPPPEPPPPPVAECPEDTWAAGVRGQYQAVENGQQAADVLRTATRGAWTRVSACRTIDGEEYQIICGPTESGGGAQCNIGMPGRRCSSTLPMPVMPVAAGMFVDTREPPPPTNSEWQCANVRD